MVGSQLPHDLICPSMLVKRWLIDVGSQMPRHLICDCMGGVDECFLDVHNKMKVSGICSDMSTIVAKCFTIESVNYVDDVVCSYAGSQLLADLISAVHACM